MKNIVKKMAYSILRILNDDSGKLIKGEAAIVFLAFLGIYALYDFINGGGKVFLHVFLPTLGISVVLTIGAYFFNNHL
ncbi:hypothetical protein SAMN05660462_00235 [Proteiniborus ethanoligenes]|uniref:Uncharacterized protein n=1 Tax=Proteiniborus ethanoligenes TaxID=415015 RepID=A0A1H3KLQ6_9FIRM|nr:hypothetical protein [Proteiniborus ethanoligenes]SDY53071.1 hypothetical protein SAMN05660462_00235 [Proteiniborus ethanoligenes]